MTKSIHETYDVFSWGDTVKYGKHELPTANYFRGSFSKKTDAVTHAKKYKFARVNKHKRTDEVSTIFNWKRQP